MLRSAYPDVGHLSYPFARAPGVSTQRSFALTGHGYEERSGNGDLERHTDGPEWAAPLRQQAPQSSPEMDLPLHDHDPPPASPPRAPHPSSSGRGIAAGLLVVGLLVGFVAGFVVGQRMAVPHLPTVADVPRPVSAESEQPPSVITDPDVAPGSEPPTVGAGEATR